MCNSQQMSFQMNIFSFWKNYLGKTGSQWPPAGFNDLTFQSTSSQPCVVWCPRAAGMKSRGGASKICSELTVNIRELLDCTDFFNCVWDLIQNNFNNLTDCRLHDWFGWWCFFGGIYYEEVGVDCGLPPDTFSHSTIKHAHVKKALDLSLRHLPFSVLFHPS